MKYTQKSFTVGKSPAKLERVYQKIDGKFYLRGEEDPSYYTNEEIWEEARLERKKV